MLIKLSRVTCINNSLQYNSFFLSLSSIVKLLDSNNHAEVLLSSVNKYKKR